MTTYDDIGKALAAEEHQQGLPLGGDPDHCDRCWDADIDRRRAECEHPTEGGSGGGRHEHEAEATQ